MCFSATASFTSAAILIPAGVYCLRKANRLDKPYWALAMLPFLFGLQQLIEGGVWVSLEAGEEGKAYGFSMGFLLFSHVFWLSWIPYSTYLTESSALLRKIFLMIAGFGLLLGLLMYLPLFYNPEWLLVAIVQHSIDYQLEFVSDAYVSQQFITVIYMMVILVPLMLSSDHYHRILGLLGLFSGFVTWVFFGWVFISVWCYFAALISSYIFFMIARSVPATQVTGSAA